MAEPTLILASNSPRRRQLLTLGGWPFSVLPANLDETQHPGEAPLAYVRRLACEKALAVGKQTDSGALVLAADTIVVDEPDVLGKPQDNAEAAAMLRRLRAHQHQVITAVAVYSPELDTIEGETCQTQVFMRDYSDAEIEAYVATGDPLDKAGAYAIQHPGFHPVERIEGCYASVMGLPLCTAAELLARFGLEAKTDLLRACKADTTAGCDVAKYLTA